MSEPPQKFQVHSSDWTGFILGSKQLEYETMKHMKCGTPNGLYSTGTRLPIISPRNYLLKFWCSKKSMIWSSFKVLEFLRTHNIIGRPTKRVIDFTPKHDFLNTLKCKDNTNFSSIQFKSKKELNHKFRACYLRQL